MSGAGEAEIVVGSPNNSGLNVGGGGDFTNRSLNKRRTFVERHNNVQ